MKLELNQKTIRNLRPYVPYAGIIFAILILSYLSFNYHWNAVAKIRGDIAKETSQEDILIDRLAILRSVQVVVEDSSDIVSIALPQDNPSIYIISHIKSLANNYDASINNLNINTTTGGLFGPDINVALITFDVESSYSNLLKFIQDLQTLSPIVNLNTLNLSRTSGSTLSARLGLYGFFSSLPETLPSINSPLTDLSDTDKGVISIIKDYKTPTILDLGTGAQDNAGRSNPFSLVE